MNRLLAAVLLFLALIGGLIYYSYFSASSSSGYMEHPPPGHYIDVKAVDEDGFIFSKAPIYVDDEFRGYGHVRIDCSELEWGVHRVSFGSVPGYKTPDPIEFLNSGKDRDLVGIYYRIDMSTYRLTVKVYAYSVILKSSYPLGDQIVVVKNRLGKVISTSSTDDTGTAYFELAGGSYTAYVDTAYGSQEKDVDLYSDDEIVFKFYTSGLSFFDYGGLGIYAVLIAIIIVLLYLYRSRSVD